MTKRPASCRSILFMSQHMPGRGSTNLKTEGWFYSKSSRSTGKSTGKSREKTSKKMWFGRVHLSKPIKDLLLLESKVKGDFKTLRICCGVTSPALAPENPTLVSSAPRTLSTLEKDPSHRQWTIKQQTLPIFALLYLFLQKHTKTAFFGPVLATLTPPPPTNSLERKTTAFWSLQPMAQLWGPKDPMQGIAVHRSGSVRRVAGSVAWVLV